MTNAQKIEYMRNLFTGESVEQDLDEINDLTRKELDKFAQSYENVFLGKINLYNDDTGDVWAYRWDTDMVYNFGADFAVPTADPQLMQMIKDRANAPYTGTGADYPLVTAIIERVKEVGGILLLWA